MVLYGRVLGHDDGAGLLDQLGDRGGLVELGVGLVGVLGAHHAEAHHHHQLAVALLRHGPGQAHGAAGPGQVEHLDVLGDLDVVHHLGGRPSGGVVAAAGGVGHHEADPAERLRRVGAAGVRPGWRWRRIRSAAAPRRASIPAADLSLCEHRRPPVCVNGRDRGWHVAASASVCLWSWRTLWSLCSCGGSAAGPSPMLEQNERRPSPRRCCGARLLRSSRWRPSSSLVQLLLIAAVLVAVSAVSVEQTRATFERVEGRRVLALAEIAGGQLRRPRQARSRTPAPRSRRRWLACSRPPGVELAAVADLSGQVVVSTDPRLDRHDRCRGRSCWRRPSARSPGLVRDRRLRATWRRRCRSSPTPTGRPADPPAGHRARRPARPEPVRVAPGRRCHAAHLPGGRDAARGDRFPAAGPLDQAADPRHGARRHGGAGRAAGGDLLRHRRGRHRSGHRTTGSPSSTRWPPSCSACPRLATGQTLDELGVGGRLRDVLTGDRDRTSTDEVVIRAGRVLVLNRMPVVHHGRLDRVGHHAARPDRARRARERAGRLPRHHRPAARADPRVRQPAAHHLGADPDRRLRGGGELRRHPGRATCRRWT